MGDFVLNTQSMDEAAKSCQELAEKMRDMKADMKDAKSLLQFSWEGLGCNEFEKQFRVLLQQLEDITENLWDVGERILSAEQAYIQADTEVAKKLKGKTQGELQSADEQIKTVYSDK